jgi:hypothetical protein
MLKQFSEEELRKPLTEEQKREILALIEKGDQDIDLSDIPEIDFSKGIRGLSYCGPMIRLREDVRVYFADLARRKHVPMNDLVNETLAKAVEIVSIANVADPAA